MKEALKKLLYPKGIVTDNFTLTKRVRFIDYLGDISGKRFLDVGFGGGYFSRLLCEKGGTGLGISMNEEEVDTAKRLSIKNGLSGKVDFMLLSAKDVDTLANEIFDVILCFEVLEHIRDDELVLRKLSRLLLPGGLLLISVPNERAPIVVKAGTRDEPGHVRLGYTFTKIEEMLGKLGYKVLIRDSCAGCFTMLCEDLFRKFNKNERFAKSKWLRLSTFHALRPLTFLDGIIPCEDSTIFVLAEKERVAV